MNTYMLRYAFVLLAGTFLSSVSQLMLKKAAMQQYHSRIREYLNPLVIFAYIIFFLTTWMCVYAYRGIPLSLGPLLESTGYLYVTGFGVLLFHEKLNRQKLAGLALILLGIWVYSWLG